MLLLWKHWRKAMNLIPCLIELYILASSCSAMRSWHDKWQKNASCLILWLLFCCIWWRVALLKVSCKVGWIWFFSCVLGLKLLSFHSVCSCTTNRNFKAASQVNPQNVLTHWYLFVVICNTEISFAQNSPLPCWGKLVISSLKLECNCSLEPKFWFRILNEHVELEFMGNVLFRTIDWKQVFNHETASDFWYFW